MIPKNVLSLSIVMLLMTTTMMMRTTEAAAISAPSNNTAVPAAAGCLTEEGEKLGPEQRRERKVHGVCFDCYCDLQTQLFCDVIPCPEISCRSPVVPPGVCGCPLCPGSHCWDPVSRKVLKAGEVTSFAARQCECPQQIIAIRRSRIDYFDDFTHRQRQDSILAVCLQESVRNLTISFAGDTV